MKKVFELKTPVITGAIQYGEFMPNDGRKKKFHCWWGGAGIGGKSDTLEDAKKYLFEYASNYLRCELNKLEEKSVDIRIFLRTIDNPPQTPAETLTQ